MGQLVDFVGGYAGLDERRQIVQKLAGQPARQAHAFDSGGIFESNTHALIIPPDIAACLAPALQSRVSGQKAPWGHGFSPASLLVR